MTAIQCEVTNLIAFQEIKEKLASINTLEVFEASSDHLHTKFWLRSRYTEDFWQAGMIVGQLVKPIVATNQGGYFLPGEGGQIVGSLLKKVIEENRKIKYDG